MSFQSDLSQGKLLGRERDFFLLPGTLLNLHQQIAFFWGGGGVWVRSLINYWERPFPRIRDVNIFSYTFEGKRISTNPVNVIYESLFWDKNLYS